MLVFIIVFALAALLLEWKLGKRALRRVRCEIRAEQYLVEPDVPFSVLLTVKNHSRLPIFFLRVRCNIPQQLQLSPDNTGKVSAALYLSQYSFSCFLMPGRKTEHRLVGTLSQRGTYTFSKLRVAVGDFLGIQEDGMELPGSASVVVLPRKYALSFADRIQGGLMGERSVNRWIYEDPILSVGFRDYTGREPQKSINWTRSLQSQKLMVRQFDHTTQERATLLFSLENGTEEALEQCFSLCRTLCEYMENARYPYAFLHNGMLMTAMGILPPMEVGLGHAHLQRILEALGRGRTECSTDLETLLQKAFAKEQLSTHYLLVVPKETPEIRAVAQRFAARVGAVVQILQPEVTP